MFSCEFWKISKNIIFIEHLQATASDFTLQIPRKMQLNFIVILVDIWRGHKYGSGDD